MQWIVERTNSWHNAHKELVWCTERRVVDFRVAFSDVTIVIGRLIRKAWSLYCWESRPRRHNLLAEALRTSRCCPFVHARLPGIYLWLLAFDQ